MATSLGDTVPAVARAEPSALQHPLGTARGAELIQRGGISPPRVMCLAVKPPARPPEGPQRGAGGHRCRGAGTARAAAAGSACSRFVGINVML